MTHPLNDLDPSGHQAPYELSAEQCAMAQAEYERLDHDQYARWVDLPAWQQCGYHRLALVDQLVALQEVDGLGSTISLHHHDLVTAVAATLEAQGWTAHRTIGQRAPLRAVTDSDSGTADATVDGHELASLIECALVASATHLRAAGP